MTEYFKILSSLNDNDGATLKNGKTISYKTGWQVALYGVETRDIHEAEKAMNEYNGNCGLWYAGGTYYIDYSIRVKTKHEALHIGKEHNQISIFGWQRKNLAYC